MRERTLRLLPAVAALALLLAVYSRSFTASWHYDDFHHIVDNPAIRSLERWPAFFTDTGLASRKPGSQMYRPLLMLSHAVNYAAGRDAVFGYHLLNFLLHLASALLVFDILRRLARDAGHAPGLSFDVAVLGAGVFALHPVNVETVVYVSSRSSGMAGAFALLSYWAYLGARGRPGVGARTVLSWVAFLLALLTKEEAAVLPALVALTELLVPAPAAAPQPRGGATAGARAARLGLLLLPYLACLGVYLLLRARALAPLAGAFDPALHRRDYGSHLATQARAVWTYIFELVFPVGLGFDRPFRVSGSAADPAALVAAGGLAALVALAAWGRRRAPLCLAGVLWFLVALTPTSLIRLVVIANEHRLYVALVGFLMALAGLVLLAAESPWGGAQRRRAGLWRAAAVAVFVVLAALSFQRVGVFRDEGTLWAEALRHNPDNFNAHVTLGDFHGGRGDLDAAERSYREALRVHPGSGLVLAKLARVQMKRGEPERALETAREATRQVSALAADIRVELGNLLRETGRAGEALEAYRAAYRLEPGNASAGNNLGNLLLESGRTAEAADVYRDVIRRSPNFAETYFGLAVAQMRGGDAAGAAASLRRFLALYAGGDEFRRRARAMLEQLEAAGAAPGR